VARTVGTKEKGNVQRTLSTAQIGRCGELLVQYRLLLLGIESAPMSTDSGVDLVAYAPFAAEPVTIQVKTNLKAKPGGGKGKAALDWWIPAEAPAQFFALVDLSSVRVWFFSHDEISHCAQQRSSGRLHLYMYTDATHKPRKANRLTHVFEFERYLLEHRAHIVFGG
jgi:hypothetical protein